MKKIFYIAIAAVFMYACEPQMDVAPDIGAAPTGSFTIASSGDNNVVLTVEATDAFLYTWDLGNGEKAEGKTVKAYYPFKGDYDITCTISGKGGAIIVSKSLSVAATDPAITEKAGFKELTGSGEGKTWVYKTPVVATDAEAGYCYMTANYDWTEFWWNPFSLDYGHPILEFYTKMLFDLDGGYNYTFIAEDGTETKGTFLLDMDNMTLQIIDSHIPDHLINMDGWDAIDPDIAATGIYQVKILEDGALYLWQDQSLLNPDDYDFGWAWEFQPE